MTKIRYPLPITYRARENAWSKCRLQGSLLGLLALIQELGSTTTAVPDDTRNSMDLPPPLNSL